MYSECILVYSLVLQEYGQNTKVQNTAEYRTKYSRIQWIGNCSELDRKLYPFLCVGRVLLYSQFRALRKQDIFGMPSFLSLKSPKMGYFRGFYGGFLIFPEKSMVMFLNVGVSKCVKLTVCRTWSSTTSTVSLDVDHALLSDPHLSTPCSHGGTNNASAEGGSDRVGDGTNPSAAG